MFEQKMVDENVASSPGSGLHLMAPPWTLDHLDAGQPFHLSLSRQSVSACIVLDVLLCSRNVL